jgi:hypothetical protein
MKRAEQRVAVELRAEVFLTTLAQVPQVVRVIKAAVELRVEKAIRAEVPQVVERRILGRHLFLTT